jgi:hypothetical protein
VRRSVFRLESGDREGLFGLWCCPLLRNHKNHGSSGVVGNITNRNIITEKGITTEKDIIMEKDVITMKGIKTHMNVSEIADEPKDELMCQWSHAELNL